MEYKGRIKILFIFIIIISLIIAIKLYFVQVVNSNDYIEKADRQYVLPSQKLFDRGAIYFSTKDNKLISAATLKTGYILYIKPNVLKDSEKVYDILNSIVKLNKEDFIFKASKIGDPYEEIATHIDESTANKIEAKKIDGVGVFKKKWRFYPGEKTASHVLGILGYKGDDFAGRYGLEKYYEETLDRSSDDTYVNFFAEIFSNVKKVISSDQNIEGDIVTTIEPSVQTFLEKKLNEIKDKWNSKQVGGIVINPQNGEIYAMAVMPDFDPNQLKKETNVSVLSNPLIESVYEMGSIIKPITMASGIDLGVVTPNTTYDDKGFLEMDKAKISNYDHKGRGVVDMQEVLNQSLNTGVAFVVTKMGKDKFAEYFKNFGLGDETGIDLPGETHGLISNLNSSRDIEYATASFGQGIALTPIETVRALCVLGNGGKLISPHIVKRINYDVGISKDIEYDESEYKQVISKETSETISRMLVNVVDKALLKGEIKEERWTIAAKTGTAQIAKSGGGGYYEDKFLHSFFGYFPAYSPKYLVFLYQLEPQNVDFASQTLAMPFHDIANFIIKYFEVPPDR